MKPVNLTKSLKKYKKGWVAIDETNKKVVDKKNVFIMPASKEYFGFITKLS